MHESGATEGETGSMRMFRFRDSNLLILYRMPSVVLRSGSIKVMAPLSSGLEIRLLVPPHAEDGEEAETAAVYLINRIGQPYRIGMIPGDETNFLIIALRKETFSI